MVLRLVLADAELELPPAELAGHPAIRKHAVETGKRPGTVLLDQNLHGPALAKLPDGKRRGRPDIVQVTLLVLLESPLAKAGGLEVVIHTRNQDFIRIRTDTRLPRGEARFAGLIAKVLTEGASDDGQEPLLSCERRLGPRQVLERFAKGPVLRLDASGTIERPDVLVQHAQEGDLTLVLGAFPTGDFSTGWREAAPKTVSIWPGTLNAWAVAGEVVAAWRARWGPALPP